MDGWMGGWMDGWELDGWAHGWLGGWGFPGGGALDVTPCLVWQEEHKQLSSMLGCEVTSMLCVPVTSRATTQVVALACAFNKLSGER